MKSSPVNIQRDCIWVKPQQNAVGFSGAAARNLPNLTMKTDGVLKVGYGSAHSDYTTPVTCASGEHVVMGVAIRGPKKDNNPYRVHASLDATVSAASAIVVGRISPAVLADSVIEDPIFIPMNHHFDGIVMIDPDIGGTYEDDPIGIGIMMYTVLTGAWINAHISVQDLEIGRASCRERV